LFLKFSETQSLSQLDVHDEGLKVRKPFSFRNHDRAQLPNKQGTARKNTRRHGSRDIN
jgi:hypothetical protein